MTIREIISSLKMVKNIFVYLYLIDFQEVFEYFAELGHFY